MPTANTKSYEVQYVHIDSPAKIPELIGLMLGINYNIDINAFRDLVPGIPTEEVPNPEPTIVDKLSIKISKNGVNPVNSTIGSVIVWDNNLLYSFSVDEFLQRYTLPA